MKHREANHSGFILTYHNCLKTFEWNPLESNSGEYKFYAPGVGMIKEESVDGSYSIDLVDIQYV